MDQALQAGQVARVGGALADAIVIAASMIEEKSHDADECERYARTAGILFGCWRSLQVAVDTPLVGDVVEELLERRKADDTKEDPD